MTRTNRWFSTAALGLLLLISASAAQSAVIHLVADLSGANESPPGSGDPDGGGFADLYIDDEALTIEWVISVTGIDEPVTLAHIHAGAAGVNGPVVVDFNAQLTGSGLLDEDLAAILADPASFYVNIHNDGFPGGAVRGQLRPLQVPEPATLGLLLLGLAAASGLRRR